MLGYLYELYNKYVHQNTRFYYLSLIKTDDTLSIHGLWPQYSLIQYPTYCKNVSFKVDKLKPIIEKLHKHWFSTQEKDEDFWKHEYEKHGSCMFKEMTEFEYFNKTLDIFDMVVKDKVYEKYKESDGKILIPLSLDFKFI